MGKNLTKKPKQTLIGFAHRYKDEYERKYLKVYKQAMLFLPIPFAQRKINQYTITMELMFEERPESLLAIFNTALYNEKPANVRVSNQQQIHDKNLHSLNRYT